MHQAFSVRSLRKVPNKLPAIARGFLSRTSCANKRKIITRVRQ